MKKKPSSLSLLPSAARCAIYCRFSDQDADAKGAFSTNDAQQLASERFIAQAGAQVVGVYTDESKTGTNLKRPGWRKLLSDAQEGKFTHVVVTYTDRLGRGEQFTIARYLLGQQSVSVACSIEHFGEGLAGTMQQQLSMMISGLWPAITSEKTTAKLSEMVRQGYWTGGRRNLFGLKAVAVSDLAQGTRTPPKRLVVVEEEAAAVRQAFATFLATDSLRSASDILVAASNRPWPDHATRNLLSSPLMIGRMVWGEITNDAFCEAIVSREVWESTQAMLSGRKRGAHRPRKAPENALGETMYLLGLAYCSCGRKMTMYGTKNKIGVRYNYYRCTGRREGLCLERDVSAARLHQAAIGELLTLAKTPWRMRVMLSEAAKTYGSTDDIEREVGAARRRAKALDTQESKIAQAVGMASVEAIPALTSQLGRIALERRQAAARVEALEEELARAKERRPDRAFLETVLGGFAQAWELATEEERRELVQLSIAKVEVKTTGLDVWLFEAPSMVNSSRGEFSALGIAGARTLQLVHSIARCLTSSIDVRVSRATSR